MATKLLQVSVCTETCVMLCFSSPYKEKSCIYRFRIVYLTKIRFLSCKKSLCGRAVSSIRSCQRERVCQWKRRRMSCTYDASIAHERTFQHSLCCYLFTPSLCIYSPTHDACKVTLLFLVSHFLLPLRLDHHTS